MTLRSLGILLTAFVLSCAPASTTTTTRTTAQPQRAQFAATATARRVVLFTLDGLGADALARQKNVPAFDQLAREGMTARVINVNPTLTGPTHVSILTGADPQRHGIVSNRFHLAGTPPDRVQRGLATDPDVDTLIEIARRKGKRVGTVSFPSIDNSTPRRTADFGLAWSYPLVPARMIELTRADFRREWVPPTWSDRPQRRRSFSPIMRARLEWSVPRVTRADVDVIAYDTTDDRTTNYDAYFVEVNEREYDARDWFAVSQRTPNGLHGSWSKVTRTTPNLGVTIYFGAIARNEAWPASFRDLLDEQVGFWPGEPEEELEVDATMFVDQLERLSDYYTRAQTLTIARVPFDLLLIYQAPVDQAAHNFLGTPEGEQVVMPRAYAAADRAVRAISDALEPEDALVVTGDHGLMPVQREVLINRLLTERGFRNWRAFSSGAHAHLYRFGGNDDSDALVKMLTATGDFERIEKKNASMHRNAGDLIAYAHPHVALNADDVAKNPKGQHGALNTHRELHTVLFAYGTGVTPGPLGEIDQTRIAAFVLGLLGLR